MKNGISAQYFMNFMKKSNFEWIDSLALMVADYSRIFLITLLDSVLAQLSLLYQQCH
tara:strand:+ start:1916 stop:2086 length:171 start_codon:yes stop_codon:yes gene_type:complete